MICIGVSDERAAPRLRNLLSAFKILESAGVRIYDEAENPDHFNNAHVPWHFPLQRLSVKELTNFLLLPAGKKNCPEHRNFIPSTPCPLRGYVSRRMRMTTAVLP